MQQNPIFTCDLFKIEKPSGDDNQFAVTFKTRSVTDVFMQTEFYSKLLSAYRTDEDGIWRPGQRTNYEIIGWPRHFSWTRTNEKTVVATNSAVEVLDIVQYGEVLENALNGILTRTDESDGGSYYHFSIANDEEVHEYSFNDRARVIAALAVLYDLEPHPRNHLEINIPAQYTKGQEWPIADTPDDALRRYYGDPSKTADVLRNEGWTREGENAHMFVFRERIGGQQQQMYKLDTRAQTRDQQVKRTAIKPIWRQQLFEAQDFTCRICLNRYADDVQQLSPDHRVPVIFQADNLTDDNFMTKLMTLCRYCNQQKREFCKRISVDYDWDNSPWAYPEKHRLDRIKAGIEEFAKQSETTPTKVVEQLGRLYQS